jgi:hypothetical protein
MKKLAGLMAPALALMLAAVPALGNERPPDPIAWKCYMCTPEERMDIALSKGPGEHYVYTGGTSDSSIYGYRVTLQAGQLVAENFDPVYWIKNQYRTMMFAFDNDRGLFVKEFGTVNLYPPESPHARSDSRLWGHHVSALNPVSAEAREIARRSVEARMRSLLQADPEHGRFLRFEFQLDGSAPLIVRLNIIFSQLGYVEYFLDHDTRTWHYLESGDQYHKIQESPDDFVAADGGPKTFRYPSSNRELQSYFVTRARWAGANIVGHLPTQTAVQFDCSRFDGKLQCYIN